MTQELPDLTRIETIVFDLGEVIIDLDPKSVLDGFSKHINADNAHELMHTIINSPFFHEYEMGKMDDSTFMQQFMNMLNIQLSEPEFRSIWNTMLLPVKPERIQMLETLRKSFQLFFLSNTNKIHQDRFDQMFSERTEYQYLGQLVDNAMYSHEVGMRKPDKNIYQYVLEQTPSSPDQVLFLDDKKENVQAAIEQGIQSVIVYNADHLPENFNSRLA